MLAVFVFLKTNFLLIVCHFGRIMKYKLEIIAEPSSKLRGNFS